jgi:hypothetical protein
VVTVVQEAVAVVLLQMVELLVQVVTALFFFTGKKEL